MAKAQKTVVKKSSAASSVYDRLSKTLSEKRTFYIILFFFYIY